MVLRETTLFSTDATVAATLYGSASSSNGSSNGNNGAGNSGSSGNGGGCDSGGFSYVYVDDDVNITMTDDGQGLHVDISGNSEQTSKLNSTKGNGNSNSNSSSKRLPSAMVSPQLRSAMEKKLLLLVACALVIPGQPPLSLSTLLLSMHIIAATCLPLSDYCSLYY